MAAQTLEELMNKGPVTLGTTFPAVLICRGCGASTVTEKDPVCTTCVGKVTATPYKMPWVGIAVMLAGVFTLLVILVWLLGK